MSPISRRQVLVTLTLMGIGLAVGCASPTLPPLPPPGRPSVIMPTSEDSVYLEGSVPVARARVLVLNTRTDEIFGQMITERHYGFEVAASAGDLLQLSYSAGDHSSPAVEFEVPSGAQRADPDGGVDAGSE
jgi:hypothetical protein